MNCRKLLLLTATLFMSASLAHAETAAKKKHKPLLERVEAEQSAPAKSRKAKSTANKATKAKGSQRLKPNASVGKPATGNLQREVVFDGSNVNGQYHSAGEAVAKVEQEKKMNDLIGMRRDYKDRMASEKERLQRGDATAAN
jgi:hypothetical protein